jgi:hypothetical protein
MATPHSADDRVGWLPGLSLREKTVVEAGAEVEGPAAEVVPGAEEAAAVLGRIPLLLSRSR